MEVIPFKVFMAYTPSILSWDAGLTFFIGTGVTLLGLVVAEKFGVNINKSALRWSVRVIAVSLILWAVFTSGFLAHVLFG